MSFAFCLFEGHSDGASWFHPSSSAAATVLQIKFHVFYLMLGNVCVVDNCWLSKGPISTPSLQLRALNCLGKSARGEMCAKKKQRTACCKNTVNIKYK